MKRVTALGCAAVATTLLAFGCSGTSAPTRPSPSSPAASISVTGPAQAIPVTISWSCLTQGAGTRGIFAGGVRDAACPAQSRALVFDGSLTAPGAPGNLTSSVNGDTVNLGWTGPTSGDQATSYVIEAGSSPGASNLVIFDTGTAGQGFLATSVPAGTYYVRVRAHNSAGSSAASNDVVVIVAGGPCAGAPGAPSGLAFSVSSSSVSFFWTAPASGCVQTGYVIEAGSTPGSSNLANFNTGSTAPTFSAGGVPDGTYYVRVRAANGSGAGGPSNEVTVTVGGTTTTTSTTTTIPTTTSSTTTTTSSTTTTTSSTTTTTAPACSYTVTSPSNPLDLPNLQNSAVAQSQADKFKFTLTTGVGCAWTTASNQTWLKFVSASGTGTATLSLTWDSTSADRNATVTIASQQRQVTQHFPGWSGFP